jgi:dihydroxyacid dehydratase/phosphogluconate dehydratase
MAKKPTKAQIERLRSRAWFDNPGNADMTALYLERSMNFGLSLEELQSGRPIIGIAQTGSDIAPCNRHHSPAASATASASWAASPSSFRSIPSRRRASGRRLRLTATCNT